MGEKIVKKIRGMSWTTKISLMLIFTLMLSIFMYQGWYKPIKAFAATAGPNAPGTAVDDATVGTAFWIGPGNVTASDNIYASINNLGQNEVTHYIKATNFGFSIPAGSTITGIQVSIDRYDSGGTGMLIDSEVKLVKAGVIQATNKSTGAVWPAAEATATFGGVADLWGGTWNDTDINNTGFGVVLSAKDNNSTSKPDPKVDYITITVTYTPPAAPGTLQFSSATYSVAESGPTATITVTRTGGSAGAVGVSYATSNGTATQPADYTTASGTLSWADGDSTNKTFTVTIINDTLDEANETVNLTLSSPTGGATLGAPSAAVLTITDDDPTPTVVFALASSNGSEATTPANMAVNLSAASGLTVTVNYSVTGGTATGGGTDYTLAAGTLTFNPGVTTQNISATIVNDTLDEANETIIVTLAGPTNATLGAQTTHTYTINDDDAQPTVAFAAASSNGAESVTPALMAVNLSAASGLTVTVNYSVTGGTATGGGTDYTLAAGTLTFNPGVTTQNISATIVDDALVEANETIIVTLAGPTNATLGAQTTHTYTINDNDAVCTRNLPTLDLSPNSQTITTDGGSAVYTLTITNNDTVACASETFNLSKTDTNSTNFNASTLSQPSVILAPGASNNSITLTVSAKAGETTGSNNTYVTADDVSNTHANQNSNTVTTTIIITNPLLHNSVVTGSTKWLPNGWGIAGGKYDEFTCGTCHTPRATNIKGVESTVTAPNSPAEDFPGGAGSPVNFQSTATPNGFGDDSGNSPRGSSTKICEVCHTYDATKANGVNTHPYAVGAALPDHYSADNTDCTSCHKHNVGFRGMGCDTCHGNPPTVSSLGGPNGLANDPGTTGSQTAGSHNMHKNTLSYDCPTCHNSYTMPDPSQDIDIGFSMFGKDGTGTTYNGQAVVLSYTGKNNTTVTKTGSAGGNDLTCSGLYCHGSTLTAGSLTSPWWDGAGTVTCGTCHGASAGTSPTAVNHPRHAGSAAGGLSVACTDCHSATAGAQGHVNGNVSWALNTGSSKFGSGAIYRTGASGSTGGTAPSALYGTCSTVYCHSNVQNGTAGGGPTSYGTPTWGAASVSCSQGATGCHGNAPATPTANNAHGTHTTGSYSFITCSACHNNGGDESANHANGTLNMTIAAMYVGTYGQGDHTPGSGGYGSCSNIYCHGNFTGGLNASPAWNASIDCSTATCHNYTNATPPTKVNHPRHVGTAAGQLNLACNKCHPARASLDGHVDLSVQWDLDRTDTKIGSAATYRALELGATGAKAPSAAYGNCGSVYCHSSVQSGNGTGAPLSYDTPTWGAASVTCDSCHGQGAGVNDGSPSTGSHAVHVATYAYTCAVCHTGHGDETVTHANRTINLAFDAATAGGSAAYTGDNVPQSGAFGNCTTTFCHGDSSNTSAEVGNWGTDLTASDACTVCHGTKTTAADGAAAVINRAPGGNATGVDTNGTIGTIVRNVSNDPEVGAHDGHLRGVATISNAIACTECHTVPAVNVAGIKGHLGALPADMTFGTLATTNGAIPSFDPSTHTCSNVYCHNEAKFSTTQHTNAGTGWAPVWNNQAYFGDNTSPLTSTECGRCHFYDASDCASCHSHVAAGNLSFGDKTKHIDGLVQGAGDCIACHASAQDAGDGVPTRRATAGEFSLAWSHKRSAGGTVTKYDCCVCHAEGDVTTGSTTANHKNNMLDFRNPDDGTVFQGGRTVADANYGKFTRATSSATLETWVTAVQNNLCLKCHDAGGATHASAQVPGGSALRPFGTAPTHTPGNNVLNVDAHFATTNATFHPIKGAQNNAYCGTNTMLAPWNTKAAPAYPPASLPAGPLISCWDCHNASTSLATGSVTAHGNAVTIRGAMEYQASYGSASNRSTTGSANLCANCHSITGLETEGSAYSAFGGYDTGLATSGFRYIPGTPASAMHGNRKPFICMTCHGSTFLDPGRPRRAEDAHGFNKVEALRATTSASGTNWTTPANVYLAEATPAYAVYNNTLKNNLIATNFGFIANTEVPAGSTINGITVIIQGYGSSATDAQRQIQVNLTKDGSTAAGTWKTAVQLPTANGYVMVGGPTDLWGAAPTAAQIPVAGFGVLISDNDATAAALNIDRVTVIVHHSLSATWGTEPSSSLASAKPYAFLRNTIAKDAAGGVARWDGWRPRYDGATDNSATGWGCSFNNAGTGPCSRSDHDQTGTPDWVSYGPGGKF